MTAAPMRGSNKLYDVPYLEENGSNFTFWKYRVELVLQLHNLWPLIDGMDKAPAANLPDYADWVYRDHEVHTQIVLTLNDKLLNTVFQVKMAMEAWDHLMTHYEGKGDQKIAYLIIELFQSTLSDDSPLDPQINALMRMANTIASLGLPLHDKLITLAIIISLPPSYETLKTILTATKSMDLSVENVRSQVTIEEHWHVHATDSSGVFTAWFKGGHKGKKPSMSQEERLAQRKAKGYCMHCRNHGHKTEEC